MFGTGGGKKQRAAGGGSYLVRPRLGALRSVYSSRPFTAHSPDKRKKIKKSAVPKMDWRRHKPDSADTAHREAVGRLRILLAESYAPTKRTLRELDSAGEETDNQSLVSAGSRSSRLSRNYYQYQFNPVLPKKHYYYPGLRSNYGGLGTDLEKTLLTNPPKSENPPAPPELMSFIEKQDEYIEELEKESKFCKEELSTLLSKVKEVINENEHLHDKQRSRVIKSLFQHIDTETETETETDNKNILRSPKKSRTTRIMEGPSIVFESRISELEAQLTQTRIDLRKAHEENETLRKKINDGTILDTVSYESYKKQLENLQREKQTLQDTVHKLQNTLTILKDKENESMDKVKRSLDVAEQTQYEKNAAESEIRRLKDELDRQHMKLREAIADQGRRIADERSAVERRYTQQIEQLSAELGAQWETTNKLHLELDIQRRENGDLRRESAQKQALIDELKKDMQNRIITLQSDIGVSGAEKGALEQQIAALQMANERSERQSKQEIVRLQAEIQSLRQRLDRADADLIHSRRENIRLTEQVASLEKEIALNTAMADERSRTPRVNEIVALPPPISLKEDKEKEMTSMIHDLENKHAATVAELEDMIHSQNQLMDKLSTECHALTEKLEDASVRHKEEIRELQANLEFLSNRFTQSQLLSSNLKDEGHTPTGYQGNVLTKPTNDNSNLISDSQPRTKTNPPERLEQAAKTKPIYAEPVQTQPLQTHPSEKPKSSYNEPIIPKISSRQTSQEQVVTSQPEQEYKNLDQPQTLPPNDQLSEQPSENPYSNYDPNQQYDPSQQYNVNQEYDPNQHYDPNQQYDPNQHYDPNQQYDVNQEYDPDQHYDPNQQYDPNQYDPNAQYDPNQHYGDEHEQQYQDDPGNTDQPIEPLQEVTSEVKDESIKAGDHNGAP